MAEDHTSQGPSAAIITVAHVDHGINMYLGIFKHAAQAAGKGIKAATEKAGELKAAAFSTAGRISDKITAAVRPQGDKIQKPVTPRQELHIAQALSEVTQVHSIDPALGERLQRETRVLRENNISCIPVGLHEQFAHQFSQATAVSAYIASGREEHER
jgi:hypothetical protein